MTDKNKMLIECIIKMVHQIDIEVVAEGVETQEQIAFLKQIECDIVQGYYYAKPMSIKMYDESIKKKPNE